MNRLTALVCTLVMALSLAAVPAGAAAPRYQSCWFGNGGNTDFVLRFIISSGRPRNDLSVTAAYDAGGQEIPDAKRNTVYAFGPGCVVQELTGTDRDVPIEGLEFALCTATQSRPYGLEIRESGRTVTLRQGDSLNDALTGGYNLLLFRRATAPNHEYIITLYDDSAGNGSGASGDSGTTGGTAADPGSSGNPGASGDPGATGDLCEQSGHTWQISKVEPTCTAEGYSRRVCTVCGKEEIYDKKAKVDHTWEQRTEQATATKAGRTYRVCTICGTEETLSTTEPVKPIDASSGSGSTDLPKLSQAEITELLKNAPLNLPDNLYDVAPSTTAPHSPGKVKDSVLQAALNRLNAMRRIAGLPSVALDAAMCENAQYGAALMASAGTMSHSPSKPAGMDDAFYKKGKSGTSSCNIASGYSLTGAVDGWMADSDASNVARVGHRRWQLNPEMGKVGFGVCGGYTAESVFDSSARKVPYNYIAWPASGNFPSDIFRGNYAWSVMLNSDAYSSVDSSSITVNLSGGGKTWTLSDSYTPANSGKYLNAASNYIIFRPDGVSAYDGTYTVTISGLRDKSGNPAALTYDVDFFKTASGSGDAATSTQQPQQPAEAGNPFTDVPAGSYYHDAVLWALDKGVTTGVTANQFQPNATCTRGQVVTFLWRAKGSPEPKTKSNPFTDVSASSPFYKAILWAQENGITTGTTATTFNPGGTCTSGHVVTFLWRAEGQPKASGSSALANTYSGQYYTDAVAWADNSGLLSGVGGAFVPGQRSPRANIVTYLYRNLAQ